MSSSTLLSNGKIYRSSFDMQPADAILIKGEEIVWIGDEDAAPPADRRVDLNRATVLPGLTDAHIHLLAIAQSALELNLTGTSGSISELLNLLRAHAAQKDDHGWIVAGGFDEWHLDERRAPTRNELDAVISDRPLLIRRYCGHVVILNSAALRSLGIAEDIEDPEGGHFGRSPDGLLNGSADETAAQFILSRAGQSDDGPLLASLRKTLGACNRQGIVAAVEAAVGFTKDFDEEVRIWKLLRQDGLPSLRLGFMLCLDPEDARMRGLQPFTDRNWQIISLKYFCDGIIGGRTGAVSEPYCDTGTTGNFVHSEEEFSRKVITAHLDGWQVAVHATGDRGISRVLSALEEGQRQRPRANARHRIEHYFCPPREGYQRMKSLGAMIVMQPSFIKRMGTSARVALGERADSCYPGQSALAAGIPFAASSDAPTGLFSPWHGMAAAVDRLASDGSTIGECEAIGTREAIAAYTSAGAYAMQQDAWRGRLVPKMAADLMVLDRDPIPSTAEELADTSVLATMVRGSFVFDAGL